MIEQDWAMWKIKHNYAKVFAIINTAFISPTRDNYSWELKIEDRFLTTIIHLIQTSHADLLNNWGRHIAPGGIKGTDHALHLGFDDETNNIVETCGQI